MKKSILLLALSLSLGVVLTSCKEEKKEAAPEETKTEVEAQEMQENHAADKADMAMNDKYQCTMDCEKGKTYDKPGKCPVCNMDMKKVEKKMDGKSEGDGYDHEHGDTDTKTEG
jgi:Heavy metal binding domain